ncbi:hypothetical protein [Thermus amyloliquefaciens]|uniref:hypothetical protein n=1 Tax=Thermus amyloliquefaciens TaxID=1449080 RepID=UPI000A56F3DE|nr:hypothetical protein [Thermus amyloliquefaciens]
MGLKRARGFAARLEPKKAYRVEGRLGGPYLLAERAWPLGKYLQAKKEGQPLPPPIQGRENPYLEPEKGRAKREEGGEEALPPRSPPGPPRPPRGERPYRRRGGRSRPSPQGEEAPPPPGPGAGVAGPGGAP